MTNFFNISSFRPRAKIILWIGALILAILLFCWDLSLFNQAFISMANLFDISYCLTRSCLFIFRNLLLFNQTLIAMTNLFDISYCRQRAYVPTISPTHGRGRFPRASHAGVLQERLSLHPSGGGESYPWHPVTLILHLHRLLCRIQWVLASL